mmetsp:Transcript_29925/g.45997  ORF Transcript_29925/g.45997 Transcript_29925/m.45997 type:complete len:1188 (-) Transcript_29925:232-3795(-)
MATQAQSIASNLDKLQDDVTSLTRVRNRLAASPDQQLPKILPALLPKLMGRLEGYDLVSTDESSDHQKLRLSAKGIVWGILDHALERLKGNPDVPIDQIMNALLPSIASKHLVIGTWALAFQQHCIQRIPRQSIPTSMMAELITCIDRVRREQLQDPKVNNKRRLTSASWLLFDTIMMASGLSPMVDWERDTFDANDIRWKSQKSESWSGLASDDAILAANADGSGVFHLFLDLLLFWPTQTPLLCGISVHSDELLRDRSTVPPEEQTFVGRGRARAVVRHKWTEATHVYLRHLKLCALRLAAWPTDLGLFQGKTADRALLLSVLLVSNNSMHGRLAADYVNGYDTTKSLHKNDKKFETSSVRCSLSVATSLLILIVGDRRAKPLLEEYSVRLGTNLWEQSLGPLPTAEIMQRPRLPLGVAARAIDFLLKHPLELPEQEAETKEIARLLIDLTLLISHSGDNEGREEEEMKKGKYWAVLLVQHFYSQFIAQSLIHNDDEWAVQVCEKCLDASEEVLSVVVELGESKIRRQRAHNGQLPLGVPVPFNNRNDLNNLLHTHRETKKRRSIQMDEALQARRIAYELITSLKQNALNRETKPFELPIFLFKCIVHENVFLQQNVAKTLEALLREYTKKLKFTDPPQSTDSKDRAALRERAVPLLGCLLDAILSDSDLSRSAAAQWISKILCYMDGEAASHLASYLLKDSDPKVAASAKSVLAMNIVPKEADTTMEVAFFEFIDSQNVSGKQVFQRELRYRVNTVARELDVSTESAAVVLYDFKFSVDEVRSAFNADRNGTLEASGVVPACAMSCEDSDDDECEERVCNICYEVLGLGEGKALRCGHEFCNSCWSSFLETASGEGPMTFLKTRCPEHECSVRLQFNHLQDIAPSLCSTWNTAYTNAFIELDPSYRFCPGPDCHRVATVPLEHQRYQTLTCDCCDTSFCFKCGEKPHQPATCGDYADFGKIMGSSTLWIRKHSKPCPGCNAPIEKNDGCNHMTCGKCHQEFCWLCLSVLGFHDEVHACNQYDPAEDAEDDYERHALFVYDRYQAHDESEDFARLHMKKVSEQPEKLVEMFWFLTNEDERVLHDGLETVIRARQVLKNSYVASFGLRKDPQKMQSLQSHQAALELFTERLSQLTERNLHSLLAEKGQARLIQHFQGLAFYSVSVSRYMQRFLDLCTSLSAKVPTT